MMRPNSKSIPNSRQKLNRIKKFRDSSPIIGHHRDGIPDDDVLNDQNKLSKRPSSSQHEETNHYTNNHRTVEESKSGNSNDTGSNLKIEYLF